MRILAVDDDPVSLELLEVLIEQIGGHQLTVADSASAALLKIETLGTANFDCILLDVQMPEMDGIELCELLRTTAAYSKTPILMVTKMNEKSFIDHAFKSGATDYLNKPFEINELKGRLNILSKAVESSRIKTDKIHCAQKSTNVNRDSVRPGLHGPVAVSDVDGVIEYLSMENYVGQLSRRSLFGSSVFAIKILDILGIFQMFSRFEFECLITDVAEAIALSFGEHQALTSYSGNGTYVCVVDDGWRPNLKEFIGFVQGVLDSMGLHRNDGTPFNVALCAGRSVRLLSRGGDRAIQALCEAQDSVEEVSSNIERSPLGACLAQHSA